MKKLYLIFLLVFCIGLFFSCEEKKPIDNNDVTNTDKKDDEIIDDDNDKKQDDDNPDVIEPVIEDINITSLSISGEVEMYVGYKQQLTLNIEPKDANEEVIWESSDEDIATVDKTGLIDAISGGKVIITAKSISGDAVATFTIKLMYFDEDYPYIPNLGGYEIVIMVNFSNVDSEDPFSSRYNKGDKLIKQRALREIEFEYNCKIKFDKYPEEAPWGEERVNWIINNAKNKTSAADVVAISTNDIGTYVNSDAIIDLTNYYKSYGYNCFERYYDNYLYDTGIVVMIFVTLLLI